MTPNDNSNSEINVWCDWLTDNGYPSEETRFEELVDHWTIEFPYSRSGVTVGGDHRNQPGSAFQWADNPGASKSLDFHGEFVGGHVPMHRDMPVILGHAYAV